MGKFYGIKLYLIKAVKNIIDVHILKILNAKGDK